MIKKKQILLTVVGALVIGSGVWLGGKKAYEVVTAVKVQERVEGLCTLETISRIEFKEEELTTLEKQGETWVNSDYPYLSYNQEAVNQWVQALMTIESSSILKNAENEGTYGISDESAMITVFDQENNSITYRIGSVMNAEDKIYIKRNDEKFLWIVPFEEESLFMVKPNLFVTCKDKLKIDHPQTVQFTEANDKTYTILEHGGTWYLNDYFAMPCVISETAAASWLDAMNNLQLEKYVGTFEELSQYGLEEPAMKVTVNNSFTLLIGKQVQESVYVRFEGTHDIYTLSKPAYKAAFEMKYFESLNKRVLHLPLEAIEKIEIVNPQLSGELVVTLEEEPAATLMNQPLSRVEAEEWLNTIEESLQMEAVLQNPEIEQKEERKAECMMTYTLKSGERIKAELVPYDGNYYILRYNGTTEVAVNKEKVTKLFNSLAQLNSQA